MLLSLILFGFMLAQPLAIGVYVVYDYARESKKEGNWWP